MPPIRFVPHTSAPACGAVTPVHAYATFCSHQNPDDDAHVADERDRVREARGLYEAVRGPELGDECVGFGSNPVDRLSHWVTSFVFAPDPTQAPWGLNVAAPHAAETGIVRCRPDPFARHATRGKHVLTDHRDLCRRLVTSVQRDHAGDSQLPASSMQLAVREHVRWRLPFNRFLFASTGLASLLGGVLGAVPLAATLGGLVFFTNIAVNVGMAEEEHWTRQLSPTQAKTMVSQESSRWRRLLRRIDVWPLLSPRLQPPVKLDGTADSLACEGDAHTLYKQRSLGWNVSAILPFLVRGGWQQATAISHVLRIQRHDARSMLLTLRVGDRLWSGSWLRAGPLWSSGHVGDGARQARATQVLVPWPSARGMLLWQCFGDAYARATRGQNSWPGRATAHAVGVSLATPWVRWHLVSPERAATWAAEEAMAPAIRAHGLEHEQEHVHSRGSSAHWAYMPTPMEGHVRQHGRVAWGMRPAPQFEPDTSFVLRGLTESFASHFRLLWKFALFWPSAATGPHGHRRVVTHYSAVLCQSSERNAAPFADALSMALGPHVGRSPDALASHRARPSEGASDEDSASSAASRHYISFPRHWTHAVGGLGESSSLLVSTSPLRPAAQTNVFVEVSRAYELPVSWFCSEHTTPAAHALAALPSAPSAAAADHVEDALQALGSHAFASLDALWAPYAEPPQARATSASYRALELRAQIERLRLAQSSPAPLPLSCAVPAPDPLLEKDLDAHAAFWLQCHPWPEPLAQAAFARSQRLQALRRVLTSDRVGPAMRPRRPSRSREATNVLPTEDASLLR